MSRNNLSEKCLYIWKIRLTCVMAVWFFICGAIFVFSAALAAVCVSIGAVLYLFAFIYYLNAFYKAYSYRIGKKNVSIRKGIIFHKRIYIEKNRVQYAELIQTPLQRIFKTCTIAYQVAGAVVYLSQIDIKQANEAMFK